MFDSDSWQEIFATIRKNKLRTFLTCFGVFWGIFMLVVMIGSGNGLSNGILSDFAGTATNSFFCWAQKTSKPYKGMKPGRNFNFNNEDTKALKKIPELAVVAPMNQLGNYEGTNNVVRGLKNGGFEVSGVYPELRKIEATNIKAGRFLNQNDIDDKRKVAVIGKRVQEILFEKNEIRLENTFECRAFIFGWWVLQNLLPVVNEVVKPEKKCRYRLRHFNKHLIMEMW
jgi:putative ABC transport system permease protein